MPDNFFDTSALGKHYHPEVGSPKVHQLLADTGSRHFISRLTLVEMQSVLAGKVRTGHISLADFQLLRKRFLADVTRRKVLVVRMTGLHFQAAERLIRQHAPVQSLRTLDAIQLAVALYLHDQGMLSQFVCADRNLCAVAALEGLAVVNPEHP